MKNLAVCALLLGLAVMLGCQPGDSGSTPTEDPAATGVETTSPEPAPPVTPPGPAVTEQPAPAPPAMEAAGGSAPAGESTPPSEPPAPPADGGDKPADKPAEKP